MINAKLTCSDFTPPIKVPSMQPAQTQRTRLIKKKMLIKSQIITQSLSINFFVTGGEQSLSIFESK